MRLRKKPWIEKAMVELIGDYVLMHDLEQYKGKWQELFPGKKLYFLPLDVAYAILLTACTIMTYNGINLLAAGGNEQAGAAIGVEPILFGIIVTAWDLLFLGCKRLAGRILADAKQKVSAGS